MHIGVVLPQTEIGPDVGAVRAYGQGVDGLGFHHLLAYDHVVGADPAVYPGWDGPYDIDTEFHEPFVTFGFLAACTSLELITGITILPQRPTVLVAKQAAEVDLLTGGRFRLGVGLGWNAVEYDALGQEFSTRGRRLEEQVTLLRALWTQRSVTMDGRFDQVTGVGIAPRPVQQPIPVWVGGNVPAAFRRAGRIADGWLPMMQPGPKLEAALAQVAEGAAEVGREPADIPMEGRLDWRGDLDQLVHRTKGWRATGASHVTINTMGSGLATVDDHLAALGQISEALGLS
jgi:probable F420-dependent oxidoreductase